MRRKYLLASFATLLLVACNSNDEENTSNIDSEGSNEEQTLIASAAYPPTDGSVETFSLPLLESVNEEHSFLTFDTYTGGELFGADESLNALESNSIAIDMVLSPTLDNSQFPYSSVIALPLLDSNAEIGAKAVQYIMESDVEIADGKTYYELEFEDKNLFVLPIHPTETYVISTSGTRLDDIDNYNSSVRLRVSSNVHEEFINQLGLTGVTLPATEIYDGLSRGSLDGVLMNIPDWEPYSIDEISEFTISGTSIGHFPVFFAMTQDTWESFSEDVQETFLSRADELITEGPQIYMGQVEEISESYEESGGEFIHYDDLDSEVQDLIDEAIVNTWDSFIDDLESRGHGGKQIALLWRDAIVDSGGTVPEEIMNLE